MSLTKEIIQDKFEIVTEYKHIQVRTATVIKDNGVEISRSFSRKVLTPDLDISNESDEIKSIANAVWTDEVKASWAEFNNND
tara:strand:- start:78 stop:323 length:246 start_codon:yes stop_codon:yes gene_type:complete